MTTVIAYWVLPAQAARNFFVQIISELAARFDAPTFPPHLTLFLASENSLDPAEVLKNLGPVTVDLPTVDIKFSEQFTKSLFLRFGKTNALQRLSDAVSDFSGEPKRDLADPHLSLLYKYLPEETKRELASSIQIPFRKVRFDSISAMRCASPTQSAADVRAWKLA